MATTSDATVVAVFEDASDARSAANDLKAAGFGSDKVYVSSEEAAASSSTSKASTPRHEGGISGWFKSLFGEEGHAHRETYESAVSGGKTLVSVEVSESQVDKVSDILERYSPVDVHTEDIGEAHGIATSNTSDAGYQGSKSDVLNARDELRGAGAAAAGLAGKAAAGLAGKAPGRADAEASQAIPVVEEELQVGKRAVQRGGVRVYSRTTERPVEEDVRLREEHVRVDRQPVNRPATEADFGSGKDQVIEVDEYAEEPVVSKQARVVEEVRVNKDATERTETVRDSVRRTDVEVENLTGNTSRGAASTGGYDTDFRQHFATAYPGGNYNDYAPAYKYGSDIANDPRYKGRDYSEIESQLRDDYSRRYPNSTWEKMKDSVRYGWDKVTGKGRSTTSGY